MLLLLLCISVLASIFEKNLCETEYIETSCDHYGKICFTVVDNITKLSRDDGFEMTDILFLNHPEINGTCYLITYDSWFRGSCYINNTVVKRSCVYRLKYPFCGVIQKVLFWISFPIQLIRGLVINLSYL